MLIRVHSFWDKSICETKNPSLAYTKTSLLRWRIGSQMISPSSDEIPYNGSKISNHCAARYRLMSYAVVEGIRYRMGESGYDEGYDTQY